jgi:hypothetical protein
MRKLNAVILFLLFAVIQVGILAWYCYRPVLHAVCYQLFLYHEASANRVGQLKLDRGDLLASRSDDDEIRWNGELYDILKTVDRGDSVLLTVKKDIIESRWLAACSAIQQQLTRDPSGHSPMNIRIYQWVFKLYVPFQDPASDPGQQGSELRHCLFIIPHLTKGFYPAPGQPPEVLS